MIDEASVPLKKTRPPITGLDAGNRFQSEAYAQSYCVTLSGLRNSQLPLRISNSATSKLARRANLSKSPDKLRC